MRQNIASQAYQAERRALVGFACALVVLQALLAVLAWPVPRAQADAAFAICHAGGASGGIGAPDPGEKPGIQCALCAHAIGAPLPPASIALRPRDAVDAMGGRTELTPLRVASVPVRAGAARAPPAMI